MSAAANTQSAKARTTAALCLLLALMTAGVTAWFVVEGIQATEPASSARWAKVASGVLLLVLELSAFGLAGQWPEHKKVLRPLGWAILALEITLMSVSQISIGLTAGKAASNGAGTIEEIRAQAQESRAAAAALRADAEKLRKSKHGWLQQQAGERSAAAAEQSKSAAAAVASLEKHAVAQVSTPIVEIVGQNGLIALSVALSLALSLSGIALMHVAGSLWRRASGALPVDVQILELLHRIHGAPAAPAQTVAPAPAPALASFKPAGTVAPKDASTGLSYSSKTALAGAGLLAGAGALTAPMAHAAPAVPTQAKTSTTPPVAPANSASETVHSSASVSVQPAPKKPRVKRAVSAKIDTGTHGKAGARFKRIKAGVMAGKIRPSIRGIQAIEGGSQDVVLDYLKQLEADGLIIRKGRGWALVKGGAT